MGIRDGQISLFGSLCNSHSWSVKVFFQTQIELVQPPQLQVGHALLLILAITACTNLIRRGGHTVNDSKLRFAKEVRWTKEWSSDVQRHRAFANSSQSTTVKAESRIESVLRVF